MSSRLRGFTLVELLVVMVIIIILTGIVMGIISRTKADARKAVCLSNLKQLGEAELIYAQDYDGYLPSFCNTLPGHNNDCIVAVDLAPSYCSPKNLRMTLQPYIHNGSIWFCPSDLVAGQSVEKFGVYHRYSSYYFNNFWVRSNIIVIRSIYDFPPSKMCIISDPFSTIKNNYHDCPLRPGEGHMGGINTCYLDGHVKWGPCY